MRTILVVLVIVLAPLSGLAQTDSARPDGQAEAAETTPDEPEAAAADPLDSFPLEQGDARPSFGDEDLDRMTRDEMSASGFEFGSEARQADTSTAVLLSLTAGLGLHGIGHLYMGDTKTGFFLLGMEAVSVAMIASAAGYYVLTEGSTPAVSVFAPVLRLGIAMFLFSHLLDVIGTLRGPESRLPRNTRLDRGFGFKARYGLFGAVGFPLRSVIDATVIGDVGGFYAHAGTMQDVFLEAAQYRGKIGVRPLRGDSELTFLGLEANGEFFEWQGEGEFGRFGADGRIVGSYQLGDGFPALDQFAMTAEVGFGYHWLQFAPTGSTTFEQALARPYVPFDVSASLNLSERFNVSGGYGSSDISWVPALHRMLGVTHVELTYRSSGFGDISLRSEVGQGFALWLGGAFWFGRR